MHRGIWAIAALLFAVLGMMSATATGAEAAPQSDVALSYPEGATISTSVPASDVIDNRMSLIWQPRHGGIRSVAPAQIQPLGDDMVRATVALDLTQEFVPAGVTIEFQWHTGSAPFRPVGEPESFDWIDARWDWQQITSGPITVWTYGDATPAGSAVLNSATATLERMQDDYGVSLDRPISIWAYSSNADFAGTLRANAREAVAGVSWPEYGVISAVLPAEQPAEIERVIPHEVSHLVLSQVTSNPWTRPPLWFDEGLAVYLQTGGKVSYERILQRVAAEGTFFELDAISWSFPYSAEGASRAYAQSWSVVAWMHEVYSVDGIARLIEAFGSGVSWDEAIRTSLGTDSDALLRDWRAWLNRETLRSNARLFRTFERTSSTGSIAPSNRTPEQELPTWPSILIDQNVPKSSIRLRSSGSWH